MSSEVEFVREHMKALYDAAESKGIPEDVLGRMVLSEIIELWKRRRGWKDVADELQFAAEHLDPDTDYEFMRP